MEPSLLDLEVLASRPLGDFASASDRAECRRLQRVHSATYDFAARLLPRKIRRRVHALYGFVRVPDQWMDEHEELSLVRRRRMLEDYRNQLIRGMDGVCPDHAVLRVFCDVMHEVDLPLDEPLRFLDAMAQDLSVRRYSNYEHLLGYMRGSAAAVGVMTCAMLGAGQDDRTISGAMALGEAMQLTNFLRDVREDAARGRIYLPREEMEQFAVDEDNVLNGRFTPEFRALMEWEIARARRLYEQANRAIEGLPRRSRRAVRLASVLYARILDRIEAQECDVFRGRARTSRIEKGWALAAVLLGR